jgi:hypothetical protein
MKWMRARSSSRAEHEHFGESSCGSRRLVHLHRVLGGTAGRRGNRHGGLYLLRGLAEFNEGGLQPACRHRNATRPITASIRTPGMYGHTQGKALADRCIWGCAKMEICSSFW